MTTRLGEGAVIGAALGYLVLMSWAMTALSYDIWGALIVGPIYGALGVAGIIALFRRAPAGVATIMIVGLAFKLGGALLRYWVGFEAYAGGIDAGEYSRNAAETVGRLWDGDLSIWSVVPDEAGTPFVRKFTTWIYLGTGTSRLAGFLTFSFMAFWGVAFFVKAALLAVPGLEHRRYALACVLFPSIIYWPSSIGKEAIVMLGIGSVALGAALIFQRTARWLGLTMFVLGLGLTGMVRPHIAGIMVAALVAGLFLLVMRPAAQKTAGASRGRASNTALLVVAAAGMGFLAFITISFLEPSIDPSSGETSAIERILEETSRRTSQADSAFTPPSVGNPTAWPFAIVRTLTRPLPNEVSGLVQTASAAEMLILMGFFAVFWRSVAGLPRMLVRSPYVVFATTAVLLTGLALSSFANLGLLTRQKSLILPLLLLIPCLPEWRPRTGARREPQGALAVDLGRNQDQRAVRAQR